VSRTTSAEILGVLSLRKVESVLARQGEVLALAVLVMAAAGASFYQSGRLMPLVDWSWTTENSYRIARGQRPFIDLGIATAPGAYLVQAMLIRLFGVSAYVQRVYACVGAALSVVMTVAILRHLGIDRFLRILLTVPLVFGVYVVYAYPNYDNDTMLVVLVGLWCLARTQARGYAAGHMFVTGMALSLPFFFKQNIGGVIAVAIVLGLAILTLSGHGPKWSAWACCAAGCALPPLGVLCWLSAASGIGGLKSYWFWTFVNAARAHPPRLERILLEYQPDAWLTAIAWAASILLLTLVRDPRKSATLVGVLIAVTIAQPVYRYAPVGILLVWAPILLVSTGAVLANVYRRSSEALLRAVWLVALVLVMNAAFLSQGIRGSTYGHWPVVSLLVGLLVLTLRDRRPDVEPVALLWPAILCWTVGLGLYVNSNARLAYIPAYAGPPVPATHSVLRGMSTPGPWLPRFEELVAFTDAHIPAGDTVVAIPGEDPFYSTTGRTPQLSLFQINPETFPYEPRWVVAEAVSRDVRWVILKKRLQTPGAFRPLDAEFFRSLERYYEITWESPWYRIMRRRDPADNGRPTSTPSGAPTG